MHKEAEKIWTNFDIRLQDFVCKKMNHHDDCYDIMQNIYIKVFTHIAKLTRAENLGSYLFRMAGNEVTDYYRKKAKYSYDEQLPEVKEDLSEILPYKLADCCLRPMIEALPKIYREALILTELEGMSQVELAKQMGLSVSGAKSRVQRAREKLKLEILNCCHYEFDRYGNILSCCQVPVEKRNTCC